MEEFPATSNVDVRRKLNFLLKTVVNNAKFPFKSICGKSATFGAGRFCSSTCSVIAEHCEPISNHQAFMII